jgi:hypothetical protein
MKNWHGPPPLSTSTYWVGKLSESVLQVNLCVYFLNMKAQSLIHVCVCECVCECVSVILEEFGGKRGQRLERTKVRLFPILTFVRSNLCPDTAQNRGFKICKGKIEKMRGAALFRGPPNETPSS